MGGAYGYALGVWRLDSISFDLFISSMNSQENILTEFWQHREVINLYKIKMILLQYLNVKKKRTQLFTMPTK